ncbi:hypothetical protein E3N88_03559 [Mikania micrantha]|uniref:Methyltransferase n=1 Tax=Mikania micrantha TaxID=192012 RepID=A0A5N6Q7B1_9ASTR|nr:hypothetical protein E3N88_03559 [Mikania micrantha]
MAGQSNSYSYYSPTAKPNATHLLRRSNVLLTCAVVFLCSFFYLFGSWQPRATVNSLRTTTFNCVSTSTFNTTIHDSHKDLDFTAHHSAATDYGFTVKTYPSCSVNYSEYTPCQDQKRSLKFPRDRLIYRERHCPEKAELLKCRIPAPYGYKNPFKWPRSRDLAWYANVPHKDLTVEKAVQNWIRFEGDRFRFPGGGTMFPNGADAYIDDIGKLINLNDGSIRTAIDTGCGVASWGAYLLSRDIIAMSFAPRDTHEAQVQFALERGVPALIGVIASKRLPYPSRAFDMAHCSRCLIPWGQYDGVYLIEVDRVLRPGGYWILSGPPINWQRYWKGWERTKEDLNQEQTQIEKVAKSLCWKKLVQKEVSSSEQVAGGAIANWPKRLHMVPPRVSSGSIEGQPGRYRNLLDMNAFLGGFAASLVKDPLWVMNIVPVEAKADTLGAIYERGLIGTYQSWCEAMSTYPRTCEMEDIMLEMDRILRPEGSVIIREDVDLLVKVKRIADGLNWESQIVDHEDGPLVRERNFFLL